MLVNHVLSSSLPSNIFSALFAYSARYAPSQWQVEVSVEPLAHANIRHYHRPQLERSLKRPCVVTVHHDLHDPNPSNALAGFLPRYREASRVICLNRSQADFLRARDVPTPVVIPHGYNDEVLRLRDEATPAWKRVRIGFFSNRYRTRFKGEAYLGELAKRLSPDSFEFLLVGEGRGHTARSLTQLGYAVRCYEHVPYRLFQSLYESIDVLLMCSNFEGGPANLPEALGTGTPVLATRVGFAPEVVEHGVNGLLLDGNVDDDAALIAAVAEDAALMARLRAGARASAARTPSWRTIVAQQFALYEGVLAGGNAHG